MTKKRNAALAGCAALALAGLTGRLPSPPAQLRPRRTAR